MKERVMVARHFEDGKQDATIDLSCLPTYIVLENPFQFVTVKPTNANKYNVWDKFNAYSGNGWKFNMEGEE